MALVHLGSTSPIAPISGLQATVNGERSKSDSNVDLPEQTEVIVDTPDFDDSGRKVPLDKKLNEIRSAFALHSESPAIWVEGTDEGFTSAVSQVFDCPIGRPSKLTTPEDNG